jgi:hypothetical protein
LLDALSVDRTQRYRLNVERDRISTPFGCLYFSPNACTSLTLAHAPDSAVFHERTENVTQLPASPEAH